MCIRDRLIVPTFYDSIEIARDHALAKFHRRAERFTVFGGFVLTLLEAVLTLLLVRFVFRMVMRLVRLVTGRVAVKPAVQG